MVETCKVAAKFDVPFVIHQRSEADTIVDSMHEVINIGRDSGVKVHFSHFKLCGKNNAHLFPQVIALLEQAKKRASGFRSTSIPMWPAAPCSASFCRRGRTTAARTSW